MKKIIAVALALCTLLLLCACGKAEEPRGIRTIEINEKGELIVIFTDGTQSNAGVVKGEKGDTGEKGADGVDGQNGEDGKDGKDGKDGAAGEKGEKGTEGRNGTSIESVTTDEAGNLVVIYSDDTTQTVELAGALYLLGGFLNGDETAAWALYNGGLLVIGGKGQTNDYEAKGAPWYAIIPMISAVYVDTSNGLSIDPELLSGIDPSIIIYSSGESTTTKWVDMEVEVPIYDAPEKVGDENAVYITKLPLGTEIAVISENENYATIIYNGEYAYIAKKYVRNDNGSVVYNAPDEFEKIKVINANGANLRTFPDATEASSYNIKCNVAQDTELQCIGKSVNGDWYKIQYQGDVLYVHRSTVEEITLQ